MKKNLIVIGAGGHGRVVADIALQCGGYESISFLDDAEHPHLPILGKVQDAARYLSDYEFIVAVGNNRVRERLMIDLEKQGADLATLVHPNAVVGSRVNIGAGTVVMAGAVINTGAAIGKGSIINTCSSVDHDCLVEDFCHISVGAHLAGTVRVGKATFVGAGATVINNITICSDCVIGAGAVVVKDIEQTGTYIGVPATLLKNG